ncbi:MAG: hypothetical protein C0483_18475 [Pirellula sp.]|nr:hypothetical protein [Pirellula sp.]
MNWFVILVAIGFGIARLTMPVVSEVHREDLFKDFAHLFVGAMFGAGIAGRRSCLWIGIALTVLEVVAFIMHKA